MLRCCCRLTFKPLTLLLALAACALAVSGPAPADLDARKAPPAPPSPLFADPQPPAEYVLHDGKVVHDGAADQQANPGAPGQVDTLDIKKAYQRAAALKGQAKDRVFKTTITPHWFQGNTRFWYRNDTKDGTRDFVVVDAVQGTRAPAFDHAKLAAGLAGASVTKVDAKRLPFQTITFIDDGKAVRFVVGKDTWRCDLTTYACTPDADKQPLPFAAAWFAETAVAEPEPPPAPPDAPWDSEVAPEERAEALQKGGGPKQPPGEVRSPDGKWVAFIKDYNLYLRDKDGKETVLTQNGVAGNAYAAPTWSPDSKTVVAYRTEPGDNKKVYLIESSPKDQLPAKFSERTYPRPGDKFAQHEMFVVDVAALKVNKVEVERIDFRGLPKLRWAKDGKHFTFEKTDRGHQRFRLVEVEAATGKTRNIIDEKAETFVDHYSFYYLQYLDATGEILYSSEIDGWKHLYLIDAKSGQWKQITRGEWVVRSVEHVDVAGRQIWFTASGKNPGQNPYFLHYYRVNFDGTGLVALTDGNGNHKVQYSPDNKYLIDTYSRPDQAAVHELRKVADGSKVCDLEKADVSALEAAGWRYPEVFVARARDGKTDIWGVVYRPQNFDANKKYPVIEYIYAGPHGSFSPTSFTATSQMAALAELGFIVVQMDGMGTAHRSRAFHDVCWKNVADAGFPDRILWIKTLAQKYAYVDITRVGIYGTSAGGQSSTGALLFHPEFYKVAVSSCGCHDNRLDKASWNEQWMGLMGPHYEKQSNVTNAHKLQGKLLLMVGELDKNVPPESTMRVVDALIRAGKDFDLLVLPGLDHTGGGVYGDRRRWDFFVRHLLGVEPPDRNGGR
jgi:dipeptidyl aminopeptidase/acylaminoacyl peptidase